MSLRWYRAPRMVVLGATSSAMEAARALEKNNIGAVIVHENQRLAGIVTDRDLAVRVIGPKRNPETTTLHEIMTAPVVALAPTDSQRDALCLMRQRNIRRIPLVESDRVVGIVTLDDLILDEAAPMDELAAVIEAQIGAGGPAGSPRMPAARRRAARAQATLYRMLNQVRDQAHLETTEQAEEALEIVLGAIVRRLTPNEADDLIAQLPSLLHPTLRSLPRGPDKSITEQTIEADLWEELGLAPAEARQAMSAVGAVVAQTVSPGQIDDVRNQLPEALGGIFEARTLQTA